MKYMPLLLIVFLSLINLCARPGLVIAKYGATKVLKPVLLKVI